MKQLLRFVILFLSLSSFAQSKPFTSLQYDKVVMYDFSGGKGEEDYSIINEKGKLAKSVIKEVILDKNTIAKLNKALESKTSYGAGTAFCFEPHLGIVYYYKGAPVGYISVCMDCNRLQSSKEILAQKQGKQGEGKDVYYTLDGMSKSFRTYLNKLLIRYNFSHQIKK